MIQEAILLTENNIDWIAQTVDYTIEDIHFECDNMLKSGMNPVLCRTVRDGRGYVEYIVSLSMFNANAKTVGPLNTITYNTVVQL